MGSSQVPREDHLLPVGMTEQGFALPVFGQQTSTPQPYQTQASQSSNQESDKVVSSRRWNIIKACLGYISILTSLIILTVGGVLVAIYPVSHTFKVIGLAFPPVRHSRSYKS